MEIKISREELSKRKLFLGLPCYGGQCAATFARSIADLSAMCAAYGVELKMYFLMNESLITRARNYICDEFMRSESTHLMFIDSDIGFQAQDVIALLALASDESPYDIIGAAYPKKTISWEKIKVAVDKGFADENPNNLDKFVGDYVFNPKGDTKQIPIGEPSEVLEIGTGFMMIRRDAMERFQKNYDRMYRPDHARTKHFDGSREIMAFFDCVIDKNYEIEDLKNLVKDLANSKLTIEEAQARSKELVDLENRASKRYLSEDYYFCQMAQKMGLKIWLCPWMKLEHFGSFNFGGSLADIAALGVSATADMEMLANTKR